MAGAAITYDNQAGAANLYGAFASGTYTADDTTPVAVNILCGFEPSKIVLFNETTAERTEWAKGMTAADYIKTVTAGTQTYETSGGPVVYAGAADTSAVDSHDGGTPAGFTIPAALQAASNLLHWQAYR